MYGKHNESETSVEFYADEQTEYEAYVSQGQVEICDEGALKRKESTRKGKNPNKCLHFILLFCPSY